MLFATDRDHDLVDVPFIARRRSISPDTNCKMPPEAIDPKPDCFPADNDTAFGKQVFHVGGAEREAMISPYRIGFSRAKRKPFRRGIWHGIFIRLE